MAEGGKTPCKLSVLQQSNIVQDGDPCVYRVPMDQTVRDEHAGLVKLEFGRNHEYVASKVIMMVGETGSGKTTLINALVNYVFGVDWNDPFRFKMIVEDSNADQAESQTKDVTSYTLHRQEGFRMPYSLTVIDTPGFGDTKGMERDREIVEQLRKFFTSGDLGISHIDAIGFVVQASQARLSVGQRYVFDSILALFGTDISDNIFLLVTFADGQEPQVLNAVKEAKMPYRDYFQFNNSSLYSQRDKNRKFGSFFWDMGCESFQIFREKILELETKSTTLTKDVLEERKRIEGYIEGIKKEIKVGLSTLTTLEKEKEILKKHGNDIDQNKNFYYEVEEDVFEKKSHNSWGMKYSRMRNCKTCKRTCCLWCFADYVSFLKLRCSAMDKELNCIVCPLGCSLADHEICDYIYDVTRKKIKKSVDELRLRYEQENENKLSAQIMIAKIQKDYDLKQKEILKKADSVTKSLERLREIALRPDPLSTAEYIDVMIEYEREMAEPGWPERFEQLKRIVEQVKKTETGSLDFSCETLGSTADVKTSLSGSGLVTDTDVNAYDPTTFTPTATKDLTSAPLSSSLPHTPSCLYLKEVEASNVATPQGLPDRAKK